MNLLRASSRKKRLFPALVLGVVLFATVSILLFHFFPERSSRAAYIFGEPLWHMRAAAISSFSHTIETLQRRRDLSLENALLREQIREREIRLLSFAALEAHHEELSFALGRLGTTTLETGTLKTAAVLARPPLSPYDTFIIDIGERGGVSAGSFVSGFGSVALGRVALVHGNTSAAVLFSAPGEETAVLVGEERVPLIARGMGGGAFEVRAPRDIPVREKSTVLLPGFETFIIGIVERVIEEPTDPFKRVLFRSPVNIFEIGFVEINTDRSVEREMEELLRQLPALQERARGESGGADDEENTPDDEANETETGTSPE